MMEVNILGCGAALPALGRHCSGQVVMVDGSRYLIDCGEGTQTQLRVCHQKLQSLEHIFISHLHGDHLFGLPGLLSTMHLCGRTREVHVYAPQGLQVAMELLFQVSGSHINFPIYYHEIRHGEVIFQDKKVSVTAFELYHSIPTFGFKFQELSPRHPHSYAYCSDTAYNPQIIPWVQGVDLLCLESTFTTQYEQLAIDKGHLTARQASLLALEAQAKRLMLTHFSARYKDLNVVLDEAKQNFPNTIAAEEGMCLRIE